MLVRITRVRPSGAVVISAGFRLPAAPTDTVVLPLRGGQRGYSEQAGMTMLGTISAIYRHRPACPGDPRQRSDGCFPRRAGPPWVSAMTISACHNSLCRPRARPAHLLASVRPSEYRSGAPRESVALGLAPGVPVGLLRLEQRPPLFGELVAGVLATGVVHDVAQLAVLGCQESGDRILRREAHHDVLRIRTRPRTHNEHGRAL